MPPSQGNGLTRRVFASERADWIAAVMAPVCSLFIFSLINTNDDSYILGHN